MSHDEAFAALQARKRAAESAGPPRVTWRKVSRLTGGGFSGLGPAGALVWVGPARPARKGEGGAGWAFRELYDYGRVTDGERVVYGSAYAVPEAKRRAEALLLPPA